MSQDYEDDIGDEDRGRQDDGGRDDSAEEAAMRRTNAPGILLIIMGVLNLLGAGYFLVNGLFLLTPAGQQAAQFQAEQMNPEQKQQMEQLGWDMGKFMGGMGIGQAVVGGLGLLLAVASIAAGAMMRSLRGYSLAVIVSILACIPFISPVGCCLLGQIFGIWSLVVLLSPDVKSAFR
jgi:hypothetical protein